MTDNMFARMSDGVKSGLVMYTDRCKPSISPDIMSETRDDLKKTSIFRIKGILPCENVGMLSNCINDALEPVGARVLISFPASSQLEPNDAIITTYIPCNTVIPTNQLQLGVNALIKKKSKYGCLWCCNSWCGCICSSIFVSILMLLMSIFFTIYINNFKRFNTLK